MKEYTPTEAAKFIGVSRIRMYKMIEHDLQGKSKKKHFRKINVSTAKYTIPEDVLLEVKEKRVKKLIKAVENLKGGLE